MSGNIFFPGTRVRAYDFEFRDDCYADGTVEATGCRAPDGRSGQHYRIRVDTRVFGGVPQALDDPILYWPVNGTITADGRVLNHVYLLPRE